MIRPDIKRFPVPCHRPCSIGVSFGTMKADMDVRKSSNVEGVSIIDATKLYLKVDIICLGASECKA